MDTFVSPGQKKQKKLLIILGAVVLVIVLILYFGLKGSSTTPSVGSEMEPVESAEKLPSPEVSSRAPVSLLTMIELDLDFFKSALFLSLKIFGALPPKVGERGRENPFLPY